MPLRRLNNHVHEVMQKAMDQGNSDAEIVDYLHAEIGAQKDLLLLELREHAPIVGSKGHEIRAAAAALEAKTLADAAAKKAADDKILAEHAAKQVK